MGAANLLTLSATKTFLYLPFLKEVLHESAGREACLPDFRSRLLAVSVLGPKCSLPGRRKGKLTFYLPEL